MNKIKIKQGRIHGQLVPFSPICPPVFLYKKNSACKIVSVRSSQKIFCELTVLAVNTKAVGSAVNA